MSRRISFYAAASILLSLILVSGCVIPSQEPFESNTPVGSGLVIESFGSDFQEVYGGEEVTFRVKFKNTGSVKAEDVFAELLGLDQLWEPGENTIVYNGEVLPDEPECRYTIRKVMLSPPDPEKGIEGGEKICTWRYIAPQVKLSIVAEPHVRLYYTYKTLLSKAITIVPQKELIDMQNQGVPLPTETVSVTKSPISFDVTADTPIRAYGSSVTFPIVIRINNIGGGTVCGSDGYSCKKPGQEWNHFTLDIKLPDGWSFETCKNKEEIYLAHGKSQTITCKVRVSTPVTGLRQDIVKVSARYGYFIDKTGYVKVLPSIANQ